MVEKWTKVLIIFVKLYMILLGYNNEIYWFTIYQIIMSESCRYFFRNLSNYKNDKKLVKKWWYLRNTRIKECKKDDIEFWILYHLYFLSNIFLIFDVLLESGFCSKLFKYSNTGSCGSTNSPLYNFSNLLIWSKWVIPLWSNK